MRIPYGGRHFRRPVLATPAALRELVSQAPLHLPRILALTGWLQANYSDVPIVMIVYSGRYATSAATPLHDWLGPRLEHATRATVPSFIHSRSVAQHMREIVRVELLNHAP
ncbi:MAG: hypothetical protein FJ276_31585 [Planctomycetes bacterium]|nr:hypothetical protein [Planctomycetota bacterium]